MIMMKELGWRRRIRQRFKRKKRKKGEIKRQNVWGEEYVLQILWCHVTMCQTNI